MAFAWRALLWAGASSALLAAGLFVLGEALFAVQAAGAGVAPGDVQRAAWRALGLAVARQALLPHLALALASWLALARALPRLEGSWRALAAGLSAVVALWFPAIGAFSFEAWRPRGPADVAGTWLLESAAVAFALLLARLLPQLGPGAFAAVSGRGTVASE